MQVKNKSKTKFVNTVVTCQLPTLPDDFAVPVQKFYTNDQTVELKCKGNLNLVGDPSIVCKADGTFEEISASCKPGNIVNCISYQ